MRLAMKLVVIMPPANPPKFSAFRLQSFWVSYRGLRPAFQCLANEKYRLLKDEPHHASLQLKRVAAFGPAESAFTIALSRRIPTSTFYEI